MALPTTGQISISDICVELGLAPTTNISLNDSRFRKLAKKETDGSTISMSDFHGKSNFAYKAYNQNLFANFAPPGQYHPHGPTTWWVKGFRIESLDQSIVLRRMVGYNSSGAVVFDKTASGKAEYGDNLTAYNNNAGWFVENTEYYKGSGFDTITNLPYSLSCGCYNSRDTNGGTASIYRVVVYDSNGVEYPIDGHRNFSLTATSVGTTAPNGPITINTTEIPPNN